MARPARPEPDLVPVDLEVSGPDAARIDQVLARPEFTGWTREQWCHEIIQTALRYYVGDSVRAVPAPPASASPPAPEPPRPPEPEPAPPEPEPPVAAERACAHPADARDYTTGTCAACGAILWD